MQLSLMSKKKEIKELQEQLDKHNARVHKLSLVE
jgi:hypothetical protein